MTLISSSPDAWVQHVLLMEEQRKGRRLIRKSLRLSQEFCYLGDMLYAGGGCELAAEIRCGLGQFRQLLYLLTDHNLHLVNRGRVS